MRRFWRVLLTGGLIGAGLGVFMFMNSGRRTHEVLREEIVTDSPITMGRSARRSLSRAARGIRRPVAEAMESVGRRMGMGRDIE